jgi:hypothetical protein
MRNETAARTACVSRGGQVGVLTVGRSRSAAAARHNTRESSKRNRTENNAGYFDDSFLNAGEFHDSFLGWSNCVRYSFRLARLRSHAGLESQSAICGPMCARCYLSQLPTFPMNRVDSRGDCHGQGASGHAVPSADRAGPTRRPSPQLPAPVADDAPGTLPGSTIRLRCALQARRGTHAPLARLSVVLLERAATSCRVRSGRFVDVQNGVGRS